jgi:hypothetical protein
LLSEWTKSRQSKCTEGAQIGVDVDEMALGLVHPTAAYGTFETYQRTLRMSVYRVDRKWSLQRQNDRSGHPGRARSPLPQLSPCLWGKCKGAGGRVNASIFLHLWIGSGVANHVVRAGSQSGLRLVLRALQTSRSLFGAACSRDLLCLRAADGEWSDIRSQRVCGRASHAAFRIAGNGDESSEREVCYCGD